MNRAYAGLLHLEKVAAGQWGYACVNRTYAGYTGVNRDHAGYPGVNRDHSLRRSTLRHCPHPQ